MEASGPSSRRAIALVGFMAAGKSTAARAIARRLGEPLLDTDELIAERLGEPIETYFEREGETAFRELEQGVVLEALGKGGVVALGGGALSSEAVRSALTDHVPVWCRLREEVAWERARGSRRPLAADRAEFSRLFRERRPTYEAVARVVLPRGGGETPAIAARWIASLRDERLDGCRIAWGSSASGEYPVVVGRGAASAYECGAPLPGARMFAIADPKAIGGAAELPPGCERTLEAAGGEQEKTLSVAERVLAELAEAGVRRDDAIVAVGGGVVGDLAGFCAAVYQRGVPVVQVPTTLVAQVDSAIGGKTGVDLPMAKNYVGAYHQPSAVLSDPAALASLPAAELAAGWAEVVKTALIAGGSLWERVREMSGPGGDALEPVIFDCALTKLSVVAEDERDSGRRAVLNLGHTVGHAIETVTGYSRYRHGETVGLGLLAALRLSGQDGLREEVANLLDAGGLPTSLDPGISVDAVISATGRDKKRTSAGLGFVLVNGPGDVEHGIATDPGEVRAAVEELRR